jgi:hypothetical protein
VCVCVCVCVLSRSNHFVGSPTALVNGAILKQITNFHWYATGNYVPGYPLVNVSKLYI